jgi:hypothetical protein
MDNNREMISSSKYDVYSKLMYVASKYFDVQNEDYLKTGLFGYITEAMAMMMRDSSFQKTMLYNESFLNTAVMPKSIYNWAKMFGVSIPAARPAYADIQVTIPISSLSTGYVNMTQSELSKSKYARYGNDLQTLIGQDVIILDRENQFIAGEFKFTLEKSVFIYKSPSNQIITVKYCRDERPTTLFQEIGNYFIKTYITSDNYLSFVVRAYQYSLENLEKQISGSSFLETKIHKFYFNDQFVGAKLDYEKAGSVSPIELRFSNITTSVQNISTSNRFAYYNLLENNTLQISFSSASGDFIPTANSTLRLQIFTTKGSSGNITFTGDVIFRLQEESLKNIPILCNFFNESSIGGVDVPSLSRIKSTIINEISTRDVIVTETDLNNYFLILTSLLETVNDGKITFVKKRDDILRRVFSAYILLRDGLDIDGLPADSSYVSKVIPTNTVTADFNISSNMSKSFGTVIKRKANKSNEFEYVPTNALDGSEDYYVVPFYMRVNLDPFRKVKYIYNLTDDSTTLSYKDSSTASQSVYILPSTISLRRSIEGTNTSQYYIVTASFLTNQNLATSITSESGVFKLSFFRKNSDTPQGGASFEFRNGENMNIVSSASVEDQNRYTTTMEFAIDVATDGSEFDFSSESQSSDFGTFVRLSHNNTVISVPEDAKIELKFENITPSTTGGRINATFVSDRFLLFFRNLDEIMFSDIEMSTLGAKWYQVENKVTFSSAAPENPIIGDYWINSSINNSISQYDGSEWNVLKASATINTAQPSNLGVNINGDYYIYRETISGNNFYRLFQYDSKEYATSVRIKDIPVVHQSFFNNEANRKKFIKQLFIYIDTLRENLGKLETNTFFDLKFYNTYGDSQYYNTSRTDLELEMDIYVYEYSEELESSIRDYVRLLVDKSNDKKSLRISSLIKDVSTTFSKFVDHIEFKGLNGTFVQYLSEIETTAKNLFAPEYLNISEANLSKIAIKQLETIED